MNKIATLLLLVSCWIPLAAEEQTEPNNELVNEFESHLIPIPVIYYTPETGVAVGGTLIYTYKNIGDLKSTQKSSIFPALIFTQNKQTILIVNSKHSYARDLWRHSATVFYSIYPNKFYGIGDATKPEDEEIYESTNNRFSFAIGRRIVENLYLGGKVVYRKTNIDKVEADGILEKLDPKGIQGGREQGLGYYLGYDSADDNFNPSRGVRSELSFLKFNERYGSTFDYTHYSFYVRHYLKLTQRGTIAWAINLADNKGDVPFTSLAMLGGQRLLRGVFEGRYRDKSLGSAQVEWRQAVSDKWGWVAFLSGGHVADELHELEMNRVILAFGGGVRFTVNKKANTVIRIDSGFTKEGYGGTYFGIGQAF